MKYFSNSSGTITNINFTTTNNGVKYSYTSDGWRYNGYQQSSWGSGYTSNAENMPTKKIYEFNPKYITGLRLVNDN